MEKHEIDICMSCKYYVDDNDNCEILCFLCNGVSNYVSKEEPEIDLERSFELEIERDMNKEIK